MLKRIATASIVLTLVVSGAAFAATQATGTKVTLHNTSIGKRLATSTGRTLYYLTSGTCTGSCAMTWPPLMTKGKPVAGTGVKQSLLGTAKRGTKLQVKYNGHRLHRYTGDSAAGQANGEGSGGVWFTVKASGAKG
jgi:predicted lipoprotein with Yx(FWY)xxD motif